MNTNFEVTGLTLLGIKPESTAPEADTFTTRLFELLNDMLISIMLSEIIREFAKLFPFLILERTQEEIAATAVFARELVEILKCRPQHKISFKDFIPAYHRQFGRQCKLVKFGFNKLQDLFESLPLVVQVCIS